MRIGGFISATLARRWATATRECADPACRCRHPLPRWRDQGISLQGSWYCSPSCFESSLRRRVAPAIAGRGADEPVRHRIPLGLLLLSRGELSEGQLQRALAAQCSEGVGRIGEWLENLGFVSGEQVLTALGLQWACPVLSSVPSTSDCVRMLPYSFLERFRMLPVRFVEARRTLYVAFGADVHYPALFAIEEMLRCRTEPCLMSSSLLDKTLAKLQENVGGAEFAFDLGRSADDVARIATSYVLKLGAREVRMAVLAGSVWLRLDGASVRVDLFFTRQDADRRNSLGIPRSPAKAQAPGADKEIVASMAGFDGVASVRSVADREIFATPMVEHL